MCLTVVYFRRLVYNYTLSLSRILELLQNFHKVSADSHYITAIINLLYISGTIQHSSRTSQT